MQFICKIYLYFIIHELDGHIQKFTTLDIKLIW